VNSAARIVCKSISWVELNGFAKVGKRPVEIAFGLVDAAAAVESTRFVRIELDGFVIVGDA
jgi:hypothetical protein